MRQILDPLVFPHSNIDDFANVAGVLKYQFCPSQKQPGEKRAKNARNYGSYGLDLLSRLPGTWVHLVHRDDLVDLIMRFVWLEIRSCCGSV